MISLDSEVYLRIDVLLLIAWRTVCACLTYVLAFVVCVCVFSCLSGSGRDGDAHAYRSSDSEHFVLNIVVFLLVIVRRMRLCCVVSLCFVYAVCGVWDLIGVFMLIACKVVRYQNVCDHRKAESRIYV